MPALLAWIARILFQILKFAAPYVIHEVAAYFKNLMDERRKKREDEKQAKEYQDVVNDPNATREDRRRAEEAAF